MLNGHAPEPAVTLEHFYEVAADGRRLEVEALLARFTASARIRNPIAIALRGMKAVTNGDLPGGVAMLKRAASSCDDHARRYLFELLIPLLINMNQVDEAAAALDSVGDVDDELRPAFLALRAVILARQGQDAMSAARAREALELGRAGDNAMIVGRVLSRTGLAAFYREDFEEAQDRALEAARWFDRIESHRNAVMAYSILYVIAHDWMGDPDISRFYARRMTMSAHLAGDVSYENFGLLAQLETAAEAGDTRRFGSIRGRLLANPMNEQFYRERFSYVVSEVLSNGWNGRFDVARAELVSLRRTESLSLPERSLCDALLAVLALTTWQVDAARTLARRTISQTSERAGKEPLFEARRRRIARIIAAAVCIAVGDTIRGKRALSRSVDPEQLFASIITAAGMDEERTPALMRGYARFVNQACAVAQKAQPSFGLTEAELEVLRALPDGVTLAAIATSLGKSKKTVERQVGSIYTKLQVANRAQAIRRARDLGIYV
jgi:ATP/maltotriose-dependent transcriptional regulator MalT